MELSGGKSVISHFMKHVEGHSHSLDCPSAVDAHELHRSEVLHTYSMDDNSTAAASSRRESLITQADSRRNSLTPESPYMVSDETRARETLLEEDLGVPEPTQRHTPTHHRNSLVGEAVVRASELISDVAEVVAGVLPGSPSIDRGDANSGIEFFASSPEHEQREFVKQSEGLGRRDSLTPESPYQTSDETRARKENIEEEPVEQSSFLDIRRESIGSTNARYTRLE